MFGKGTDECGNPEVAAVATWWSADGTTWTRGKVNGASAEDLISVQRISDHALLATDETPGPGTCSAWTSIDGRSWTSVSAEWTADPCGWLYSSGQHGILISGHIWAFDSNLKLLKLNQTGDPPPTDNSVLSGGALGPTGFLFPNDDGTRFWLGVPTAG